MANQTKLTADKMSEFENALNKQRQNFENTKRDMDRNLNSGFLWEDPVAQQFKSDYAEGLKPLEAKLLPAIEGYERFLNKLAEKTREFERDKKI